MKLFQNGKGILFLVLLFVSLVTVNAIVEIPYNKSQFGSMLTYDQYIWHPIDPPHTFSYGVGNLVDGESLPSMGMGWQDVGVIPSNVSGVFGQALRFNSTTWYMQGFPSSNHRLCTNYTGVGGGNFNCIIQWWMKIDNTTFNANIFSWASLSAYIDQDGFVDYSADSFRCAYNFSANGDGLWHHYAFFWNKTGSGGLRIFKDGVNVVSYGSPSSCSVLGGSPGNWNWYFDPYVASQTGLNSNPDLDIGRPTASVTNGDYYLDEIVFHNQFTDTVVIFNGNASPLWLNSLINETFQYGQNVPIYQINFTTRNNVSVSSNNSAVYVTADNANYGNHGWAGFVTINTTQVGTFPTRIRVYNDDGYNDLYVTYSINGSLLWNEQLPNTTVRQGSTMSFSVNYSTTVGNPIFSLNDTTDIIYIQDNQTNQTNITFTPTSGRRVYDITLTLTVGSLTDTQNVVFTVFDAPRFDAFAFNDSAYYGFESVGVSAFIVTDSLRNGSNVTGYFLKESLLVGAISSTGNVVNGTQLNFTLDHTLFNEFDNLSFVLGAVDLDGDGTNTTNQINITILEDSQCADSVNNDGDLYTDLQDADCSGVYDDAEFGTIEVEQETSFISQHVGGSSNDVDQILCDISIRPVVIRLIDKKAMQINITNHDGSVYTPVISLEGDSETISRIELVNNAGSIPLEEMRSISLQYTSNMIGISIFPYIGEAKLVLKSDRCKDITVPIDILFTGAFNTSVSTQQMEESKLTLSMKQAGLVGVGIESYLSNSVIEEASSFKVWMLVFLIAIIMGASMYDAKWAYSSVLNGLLVTGAWIFVTIICSILLISLIRIFFGG